MTHKKLSKTNRDFSLMAKLWRYKKLEKLEKTKDLNPQINADFAENLATGRTKLRNRKKECPKFLN